MTTEWKVELLKAMHKVMMNVPDENCYLSWIVIGVPDEPQEEDFTFIAENPDLFEECVELFCNLVSDFI